MNKCPKSVSGNHRWEKDYGQYGVSIKVVCGHCGMVDDTYEPTEQEKAASKDQLEWFLNFSSSMSKQIPYKGVHYIPSHGKGRERVKKWCACVTLNGKKTAKFFSTMEEAVLGRSDLVKELHGDFAYLEKISG